MRKWRAVDIGSMRFLIVSIISFLRVPAACGSALTGQFLRLLQARSSLISDDGVESAAFVLLNGVVRRNDSIVN